MKDKVRTGSVLSAFVLCTSSFVLLLPAAPAPLRPRPAVEVVFCLDATASTAGLLEGAKAGFWAVCHGVAGGRPTPALRVGVVAYRDRGDEFVTRVVPLTADLDAVYRDLSALRAEGGGDPPESVNQALFDAVHRAGWSSAAAVRVVFLVGDAPPHTGYPEDVKYPATCRLARERGILVNALQGGADPDCARHWKAIARLGGGEYAALGPKAGESAPTPHDPRLAQINARLAGSGILPTTAAADRAGFLARQGWDAHGRRAGLLREALDLDRRRRAALARAGERGGLAGVVLPILRKQARKDVSY